MPHDIVNPTLYGDRTVQDWHRDTFGRDAWAIDLDLMGACHKCREPLYLVESTTNPHKATTILLALSRRSRIPALVILHDTVQIRSGTVLTPIRRYLGDSDQVADYLQELRSIHMHDEHADVNSPK